jgi:release factor glutamine methyltransferase
LFSVLLLLATRIFFIEKNTKHKLMSEMEETKYVRQNSVQIQLEKAYAFKDNYTTIIAGYEFIMYPDVFNPEVFVFPTSMIDMWLRIISTIKPNSLLEIGAGAGYLSILAALNGANRVTATDISQQAVANTQANINKFNLGDRMKALCGSVFEPLSKNDLFDVIFWNIPLGCHIDKRSEELNALERTVFDPDYGCVETYFKEAYKHLTDAGRLLIIFSNKLGDSDQLLTLANKYGWRLELMENHDHEKTSIERMHNGDVDVDYYELIKQ